MRVADYIMRRLEQEEVRQLFMLSGGGIMYLCDAVGRSNIEYICCHHEQAAAIAAESYAIVNNSLGVCLVTTGPGGTNALTATGASYVDSTPVLFLSGQVKTADFASLRGVRQFGAQENDIVDMAKPVTKYAVTIMDKNDVVFELEKAIYIATHGRKGPVWVDVPLDIQASEIDIEQQRRFCPSEIEDEDILKECMPDKNMISYMAKSMIGDIKNSKRPLILAGHGLKSANAYDVFYKMQKKIGCPVVTTWRTLDLMDYSDEYFYGSPGLQANRYSNIITQCADLIIVLGSRLDNMITAFNEEHFGVNAKKYIVDIDKKEIDKLHMESVMPVCCDVKQFIDEVNMQLKNEIIPDYRLWLDFCCDIKNRYPLLEEEQEEKTDKVDLYQVTMTLSDFCRSEDVLAISSTSRCNTAGHMAFKHKRGQRLVSCMGFGSMGFALPCAIGAYFAADRQRVIMLEGDGSLQLNIQELQTIVHYNMDVKMFVFHNDGYAAISTMQNRNFDGFHVGCDAESGVSMPNLKMISNAYTVPYYEIRTNSDIIGVISQVMKQSGPVICEFFGSVLFDEIPKCISYVDEEGNRKSALLENPFPFLKEEELRDIFRQAEEV